MSRLFNTTIYVGMNDISVTTGNADGWIVLGHEAVEAPARQTNGKRSPTTTEQQPRRTRKSRS